MSAEEINFLFNEQKATQAAARLIDKKGGTCDWLWLVKILYISDREAIKSWGEPISGGPYFSLPHGPVISPVLKLANGEMASRSWTDCIAKNGNDVSLASNPGDDELSDAERDLLDFVFEEFGGHSPSALRHLTHQFPEWKDPAGSSLPITGAAILHALGRSEDEIAHIAAETQESSRISTLLKR